MPVITLPTSSTSNWGEAYNTAINAINAATDNNTLDIAGIEVALAGKSNTNHTHSTYATTTDLDALETVVGGKADDTHLHTVGDITDLSNLIASVSGLPTIAILGLDKDHGVITAIASLNTTATLLRYEFEISFGTTDTYYPKPTENQVHIQKPPSTWSGWSVNDDCTLTVKVKVTNMVTGSSSTQATSTVTCKQFAPITASDMITALKADSTAMTTLVEGVSAKVLVEVSAIQTA